jgi:hypothetical protein
MKSREQRVINEIHSYIKKASACWECKAIFACDEYACYVANTYFSEELYIEDIPLLDTVIRIFNAIGSTKNTKILTDLVTNNIKPGEKKNIRAEFPNKLFPELTILLSEKDRNLIRTISTRDEYEKYARNFEEEILRSWNTFATIENVYNPERMKLLI